MKSYQKSVLEMYVRRAISTGTLADAAIAADYLAKVCGRSYASCMDALVRKYRIRYAERVCKDRPGMYVAKNPENDMLPVKWDRTTVSVTKIPQEVPADILMAI